MLKRFINSFLFAIFFSSILLGSCDGLPDNVDVAEIPDYYFVDQYLDNRVMAIKEAIDNCSEGCVTFFWITDIHWEPELNTRNAPRLIKYIVGKTGINKVLNGGDTGNSKVICKNAISQLQHAIGSNMVFTVTGNHEINDASRYENPFERVADELRSHNDDVVYGDYDKSYFYYDDIMSKTRYIGLSAYGLYINGEHEPSYTPEQLSWFNNMALDVEAGWIIVIFTHSLYHVSVPSDMLAIGDSGERTFIDAINNYKGNGSIACVLMGHTHRDRIHIGTSGIPYIISASDRYVTYKGDINVDRIPGTVSEQHFEVVIIDKGKRQVKLFSVGACARDGIDNEPGREVDVRIVNY